MLRICNHFNRVMRARGGNALVIFGFSLPILFGVGGLAVDLSRAFSVQSAAQNTLDAAMLAAARTPGVDDDRIEATIEAFFRRPGAIQYDASVSNISGNLQGQNRLVGSARVRIPTTLLNVIGHDRIDIQLRSTIERGLGNVEIALVLDSTRSMQGTRLSNVKTAATQLIDQIYALPNSSDKIKVALVPFAQYVNVGLANRNASWMAVPPNTTTTQIVCSDTYPNAVKSNCRMVTYTAYDDGVPYTAQYEECDWNYGAPVNVCGPVTTTNVWNGCAGARVAPLNIKDEQYATRIPGIRNVSCPSQILPLSKVPADIKNGINAMFAQGETYIPSGLVWGWRTLSNRQPFTESADDPAIGGGSVRKFLVLMTDGYNTKSPRYPEADHEGTDAAASNQLTRDACDNIKADTDSKIDIYTIAFEVADESVKDILRYCATPGGAFFDAVDYSRLLTAFSDIGSSISVARISR